MSSPLQIRPHLRLYFLQSHLQRLSLPCGTCIHHSSSGFGPQQSNGNVAARKSLHLQLSQLTWKALHLPKPELGCLLLTRGAFLKLEIGFQCGPATQPASPITKECSLLGTGGGTLSISRQAQGIPANSVA